ncbi:MAG: amidohydrolase family protein [Ilumatobacteraceae bacterium]
MKAALDRSIDVDSHEMIPCHVWLEWFGDDVAPVIDLMNSSPRATNNGLNTIARPDIVADDAEITSTSVWNDKGAAAPGAFDMDRRIDAMDAMGVDRSLVFPSFGLIGIRLASSPELGGAAFQVDLPIADARRLGVLAMDVHNRWGARVTTGEAGRRARPVGVMLTESVDQMLDDLHSLIASGYRAVWIPTANPPAETSPADPALDAFWRTAADADVAVLLHIGTDFNFPASTRWTANVDAFATPSAAAEFPVSPFTGATVNFASENFISAMVLGGVFERVPNLRFGAIEVGAGWLGPLAERLDMWAEVFPKRLTGVISARPSEYLARNLRVTPFHFEPIDTYFERFPTVADCFCFSTDYPHVEGGIDTKARQAAALSRLGPDVVEGFFATNGEWLVPA